MNDYLAVDCAALYGHHNQTHLLVSPLLPNINACASLCSTVLADDGIEWIRKTAGVRMLKHVEVCLRVQVQQVSALVCRDKRVGRLAYL